jgi:hypothetical protein
MASKKGKVKSPKETAAKMFRKGLIREDILHILKKEFPEKSVNALNIAMTRAAREYESELIRDTFKK